MSPPVLIIGVDPGESTGVVMLRLGQVELARQGPAAEMVVLVGREAARAAAAGESVLFAVERFVLSHQGHHTAQPMATEVIGVIDGLARELGVSVVRQAAADAVRLAPNPTLRRLGLLLSGRDVGQRDANDANSALRHALLALSRHHATRFAELYGWYYDSVAST